MDTRVSIIIVYQSSFATLYVFTYYAQHYVNLGVSLPCMHNLELTDKNFDRFGWNWPADTLSQVGHRAHISKNSIN